MNKGALKFLALAVVVLVAILVALDFTGRDDSAAGGALLFPNLKSHINSITGMEITRHGEEGELTIVRDTGGWVVRQRDNYPADIGKIRAVLLALADARILERKTANPEHYATLGIQAPDADGSTGIKVSITGDDFNYALIVGKSAPSDDRYVRIDGEAQGLLIDRDPKLPDAGGGWLLPEIIDLDASGVRAVTITHADGETLHIRKEAPEDSTYSVDDIAEGRELSYPSVANGMAGVLENLTLDDVRPGVPGEPVVTTVFDTFDGLQLTVRSYAAGDTTWIELEAVAANDDDAQAAAINARVSGWQYKIADYKARLLARRWEDILRAPAADE